MGTENKRCPYCFEEYSGKGVCPFCGWGGKPLPKNTACLAPGTVLKGRYALGRVLGNGGFGVTYLAWDQLLKCRVAVKEYMPAELSMRDKDGVRVVTFSGEKGEYFRRGRSKFLEEAQFLAKFESDHAIVNVLNFFEENNTAYNVMEYIDGRTIASLLKERGRFSPRETVNCLMPIIESLQHVHEQGLIHRDIAPDNIMLTKNGAAKLIDFGAARYAAFNEQEKSLTVMVKHGYSPPEQYMSKGERGPFIDVYSIGATMYKMLTGVTPPESLKRKIDILEEMGDPLEPLAKYAPDAAYLEPVILDAMQVFVESRIPNMQALAARLRAAQPSEAGAVTPAAHNGAPQEQLPATTLPAAGQTTPADAAPDRPAQKGRRSGKGGKAVWAVIAALAVTALVIVSVMLFTPKKPAVQSETPLQSVTKSPLQSSTAENQSTLITQLADHAPTTGPETEPASERETAPEKESTAALAATTQKQTTTQKPTTTKPTTTKPTTTAPKAPATQVLVTAPQQYKLTITFDEGVQSFSGTQFISVSAGSSSVTTDITAGLSIQLKANSKSGYKVTGWSGSFSSSSEQIYFNMPSHDITLHVSTTKAYRVDIVKGTGIGTALKIGNKDYYAPGDRVQLSGTARTIDGYEYANIVWKMDNQVIGTGGTASFTMPAKDVTVYVSADN